jgi:hypothetical protein
MITLSFADIVAVFLIVFILYKQTKLQKHLDELLLLLKAQYQAKTIEFFTLKNGQKTKVENMFLKVSEALPLSIEVKDIFGNMAKVDGAPAWALTDSALGTLEVAEGGMSAVLKPAGLVGALKVQVSVDADLGEGVKTILGELEVQLLSGEAVSVVVSAGEAVPI